MQWNNVQRVCCSQTSSLFCLDLQYMVDCSQVNNLPTISFVISGVALPLPPSAYITQASYHMHACIFACVAFMHIAFYHLFAMTDICDLLPPPAALPEWIPVLLSGHHPHLPALSERPAPVDLWRRLPQGVLLRLRPHQQPRRLCHSCLGVISVTWADHKPRQVITMMSTWGFWLISSICSGINLNSQFRQFGFTFNQRISHRKLQYIIVLFVDLYIFKLASSSRTIKMKMNVFQHFLFLHEHSLW